MQDTVVADVSRCTRLGTSGGKLLSLLLDDTRPLVPFAVFSLMKDQSVQKSAASRIIQGTAINSSLRSSVSRRRDAD